MLAKVQDLASRKPIGETMFKTVQEKGADAAVAQYRELKTTQPAAYDFSENELIDLGYRLIHMKKFVDAIAIFKLSVEAYPQSHNTYDSLAEAYMDDGDEQLAIENYQKSLQINPGNTNGVKMLQKTRLSEVIQEANSKGPQIITRHGSERAVILSIADYRSLTAHKPNLKEYLLGARRSTASR